MHCHIEDMSDRYQASVFSGRKLVFSSPGPYLKISGVLRLYVTIGKHPFQKTLSYVLCCLKRSMLLNADLNRL